jgi:hypothetical protein
MLVYDILNNFIECPELLYEIDIRILCRNTRNLDLFVIPNFKTISGNNTFLFEKLLSWPIGCFFN